MDKSFVTLEQKVCAVCAVTYDSGALLIDKRLRDKFNKYTTTGFGMCDEHQKLKDDGYIALVACDESKSDKMPNGNLSPEGAYRTGGIAHLRKSVWPDIMNVPIPKDGVCFCDELVIEALQGILLADDD